MADITISLADLAIVETTGRVGDGVLAEDVTAGSPVNLVDSQFRNASASDPDRRICDGLAITGGLAGETIAILRSVERVPVKVRLTAAAGLTQGTVYAVSANQGRIAPHADLVSGNYVTLLGVASDGQSLDLLIQNSDTQVG